VSSAQIGTRFFLYVAGTLTAGVCIAFIAILIRDFSMQLRTKSIHPFANEMGVDPNTSITLTFNKAISRETLLAATILLRDNHGSIVPGNITYNSETRTATLIPTSSLNQNTTYEVTLHNNILDHYKHSLMGDKRWRFTTGRRTAGSLVEGPGGPILLIKSKENGFTQYYAEILRNEGFNEFDVKDLDSVSATDLANHEIVLIGEMPIDERHIRTLTEWVRDGGKLITMRPPKKLAELLGLIPSNSEGESSPQQSGYLKISGRSPGGAGLVQQPIQFHGNAEQWIAPNATILAWLYKDSRTATDFPAVSSISFGSGTVIVFSYDLAKSVVYTRQGNPQWSGVERDGLPPVRSDDLFYGASEKDREPEWVDPHNIAIPQADVQQRLLSNLIVLASLDKTPLPHFWYLPQGLKAAIVMTGDDHGHGGTIGRFLNYQHRSTNNCSVENWECIRATSNIFVGSISPAQATYFTRQGFEIGLHVYTACTDWPTSVIRDSNGVMRRQVIRQSADALYSQQLEGFATNYPDIPAPVSNRTDCVTWGDYDTQPQIELTHRIRLDTNYYYWPPKWVKNRPGLFTGSGMPMRFARRDGTLIDVYQATTQMTDESKQSYPFTVDTLLANALGSSEYFGVFTANMHNDQVKSADADSIITSAQKHHIPVITAAQLLKWLDGRNASAFRNLKWSNNRLSFSIQVGIGGNGIEAMLPFHSASGELASVSLNGVALQWQKRTVAGLSYAVVRAAPGLYVASYLPTAKN